MKLFFAFLTFLVVSGATLLPEKPASYWKKAEKNLERIYKSPDITRKSVELNEKELSGINSQFVNNGIYHLLNGKEFVGFMVLTSSMGRFEPFDYMVVYNTDMSVKEIDVLNYTSPHGGEVASQKWLKQFVGYNGKHLKYGSDIDAITGATYSASSLVKDIGTITNYMKKIKH